MIARRTEDVSQFYQRLLVIVSAALLVSACATPTVMLKHEKTGQIARCGGGTGGSTAGGMIGYSIEKNSDERCVQDFEAKGFRRISP